MKKNRVKVSIIIPVYNVEKYLKRCIESIIELSFQQFEVICIDDGSCDNSLRILEEMAAKDKRVVVVKQKNMGCSMARNAGLELATGDYIMFVDADDYVDKNIVKKMVELASKYGADVVKCNRADVYLSEKTVIDRKPIWNFEKVVKKHEFKEEVYPQFFGRNRLINVYQTLIKSSAVADIRFDKKMSVNEDEVFAIMLFDKIKVFAYTPEVLYYHVINQGGLSRDGVDIYERLRSRRKCLEILGDYSKKWGLTNGEQLMIDKKAFVAIYTAMQTAESRGSYSNKKKKMLYKDILTDEENKSCLKKCRNDVFLAPEKVVLVLSRMQAFGLGYYFSKVFGKVKTDYRFKLEKFRRKK